MAKKYDFIIAGGGTSGIITATKLIDHGASVLILEEGINEAGAVSSFIAAGMSYSNHGIHMIPFYIYYSMFGFQRVWDFIWAAGDMRARGFLLGATAGRTTLNGEGLQHQDGHSLLAASVTPNINAYDLAYSYEIAVVVKHGIDDMVERGIDVVVRW